MEILVNLYGVIDLIKQAPIICGLVFLSGHNNICCANIYLYRESINEICQIFIVHSYACANDSKGSYK